MIVTVMCPLSMVEDEGFRKMISTFKSRVHTSFKNLLYENDV